MIFDQYAGGKKGKRKKRQRINYNIESCNYTQGSRLANKSRSCIALANKPHG